MSDLSFLTNINDICLFVPDMEAAIDFYQNKMKFEVKSRRGRFYTEFVFCGTSLTLWAEDEVTAYAIPKEYLGKTGHHFMLAIKVPTSEVVDDISAELKKNGVECISEPQDYHWECRASYFKDIFGNIWEVFASLV